MRGYTLLGAIVKAKEGGRGGAGGGGAMREDKLSTLACTKPAYDQSLP